MPNQCIVIMTDTQRADWLSCYGNSEAGTPNLHALADAGFVFERAYTCQAVCSPARSALFTGSYPHTNGMLGNEMYLYSNIRTVGERLSDAGIHAAYVGKWHLDGGDYFGRGVCPRGWDPEYWYDMRNYLDELTPEERQSSRRFETIFSADFSRELTYAHRCAKRAKHFIAKHRNEDYLLVLSFDEPHHPSLCPPEFYERFQSYVPALTANMRDPLTDKPLAHRLWAEDPKLGVEVDGGLHGTAPCAESVRRYLACGAYVDMLIGEVLEVIEKNAKEALIVYTADHGELAGAHRLRGKGSAMYEENVRIPFIVRPPGGAQARDDHVVTGAGPTGRRIPSPVSHISVTPTILDFFGVAAGTFPGGSYIEGTSLLPFLLGGAAGERRDAAPRSYEPGDAVFLGFNRFQITRDTFGGFQPVRAIVEGSYKLVLNLMDTDELYDLDTDPQELCNLIAEESPELRSVRDNLHDRLLAWMDQTLDPYRGYLWGARPWRSDRHATWKDSGLARQRWDELYDERQIDYRTGLPFGDHRTYSQY